MICLSALGKRLDKHEARHGGPEPITSIVWVVYEPHRAFNRRLFAASLVIAAIR